MSAYTDYKIALENILLPNRNFDILKRRFQLSYTSEAMFYFIDGFVKDASMSKVFEHITSATDLASATENIPYVETETTRDVQSLVKAVMSGATAFIIDGSNERI